MFSQVKRKILQENSNKEFGIEKTELNLILIFNKTQYQYICFSYTDSKYAHVMVKQGKPQIYENPSILTKFQTPLIRFQW